MKQKTVFYCTECGNESPKWLGKCPGCGAWNTLAEAPAVKASSSAPAGPAARRTSARPVKLSAVDTADEALRWTTHFAELDRVLGGGAVKGSLVLVGGAPGIGKSTLLLQACAAMAREHQVLYVSGEESLRQLRLRADRVGMGDGDFHVLAETDLDTILDAARDLAPEVLIIDSVQTLQSDASDSAPGSISQVRECASALMHLAKGEGITTFIVSHINKDGNIAGPKVMEHIVDCVLYFEGSDTSAHRILRAAKNRFGSTNEIGVFEMEGIGLVEVLNPSEAMLAGRPGNTPGSCVVCAMEGTRPILAEIQALVTASSFTVPRRTANGFDSNRATMLMAVLEKRSGLRIGGCDGYLNVVGGLYLREPAADLAAVLAIASGFTDIPVGDDLAAIGEVGLTGELRSITNAEQRISEIARLGFRRCILPGSSAAKLKAPAGLELIPVSNIREALSVILSR